MRECEEALDAALARIEVLEALRDGELEWSSLVAAVSASHGTLDRTLTRFSEEGLIRDTEAGYALTGTGRLLVECYRAHLADALSPEERDLVRTRREILAALASGPQHKPALVERVDASRSTVDRAATELEAAGLVARESGGWTTTTAGTDALSAYRNFLEEGATILQASGVFEALAPDVDVPTGAIPAADVEPHCDRYRLFDLLADRLEGADGYRAVLPRVDGSRHVRLCHRLVTESATTVELVAPAEVLVHLREEFPYLSSELAGAEGFRAFRSGAPEVGLFLPTASDGSEDRQGPATPTSVLLVGYDETGVASVVDTDMEAVVSWASDTYARLRGAAEPATDRLETAAPDPALPRLDGDRLPVSVRTAGFERIDEAYFRRREPCDPATAWRAGLGLPEVQAGYAVARQYEGERTVAEAVSERLLEGEDVALLGGPGSGKSTVCKRVAHRWYEEEGTVLYRESGRGQAFDAPGALEATLERVEEPALVVVEDAVRAGANAVFEAMRRVAGDSDVRFLVDARASEWHEAPEFTTDARLEAFRRERVAVVHLPLLEEADCERLLDRVEAITDTTVGIGAGELFEAVRETGPVTTGEEPAAGGRAVLLFHRLSRYVDPLADAGDGGVPTSLAAHVDEVREDLAATGATALAVGVLANVLNAAGIGLDPAALHAPAIADWGSRGAVYDALDRLEGDVLFSDEAADGYRAVHETWSVEFLVRWLDGTREARARDLFSRSLSALLALATDAETRAAIRGLTGETAAIEDATRAPDEWVDRVIEGVFGLGRTRPKLAPLFDAGGECAIDVPRHCEGAEREVQVRLGRMLLAGGFYDRAERAFERLDGDDDRLAVERLYGLGRVARHRGEYEVATDRVERCRDRAAAVDDRVAQLVATEELGVIARQRGAFERAREYHRSSVETAREVGDAGREARSLKNLGVAALRLGDAEDAREHFERSLELFRSVGDRNGEARCLSNLGMLAGKENDNATSREYFERALDLQREVGDRHGQAKSLMNLGLAARVAGDPRDAREYLERSLSIHRDVGDRQNVARTLANLGVVHRTCGELDRAREVLERSVEIYDDVGDRQGYARSLSSLARVAKRQSDYATARELADRSRETCRDLGNSYGVASATLVLGHVARCHGDLERAREHYERSLEIYREIGDRRGERSALVDLGLVAQLRGDYATARERYRATGELPGEAPGVELEAVDHHNLGTLDELVGEYDRARERLERSLELREEVGDPGAVASTRHALGRLAEAREDFERARTLHERSLAGYREVGARTGESTALHALGRVALRTGRPERAREHLEEALEIAEDVGHLRRRGASRGLLGAALVATGEPDAGRDRRDAALEALRDLGTVPDELRVYTHHVRVEREHGDPAVARELAQEARERLDDLDPPLGRHREELEETCGQLLAEE